MMMMRSLVYMLPASYQLWYLKDGSGGEVSVLFSDGNLLFVFLRSGIHFSKNLAYYLFSVLA